MTEAILIIFAAILIYYVATRVAPQGLLFKLKKEEDKLREKIVGKAKEVTEASVEGEGLSAAQEALNRGNLETAEKKFIEILKDNPDSKKAYHFLGIIYLRQEEYNGAIASLNKAVELDPVNDTAYNNLGLAYLETKKYDMAIQSFEKSISLNDKIAHRYVNLGLAAQNTEDWEKAAIALESACKIHENPENLTLLTKNYLKMGDNKLALKTAEKILEIDKNNAWAKRQISAINE